MDTDEVIKLARDARFAEIVGELVCNVADLQRFASLVAAHEREECAKVCDRYKAEHWRGHKTGDPSERANPYKEGLSDGAGECAAAIRQRGNQS